MHKALRRLASRIAELQAENATLRQEIVGLQDSIYWEQGQTARTSAKLAAACREADHQQREAENRAWQRQHDTRQIADRLERARAWGQDYEVERLTEKLRRLA